MAITTTITTWTRLFKESFEAGYDADPNNDLALSDADREKFLEDCRTFKDVMYAFGRAFDDTSAVVLDISKLDPAYVTVKTKVDGTVSTKASA